MASPRAIQCPTCKKLGAWFQGAYGPFCSRRCKLIDLGKWLGEENRISEPLRPEHLEDPDGPASPQGTEPDQPEQR